MPFDGQTGEGTALESELAVWFFGDVVVFGWERRWWGFWGWRGVAGPQGGGGWSTGCGPGGWVAGGIRRGVVAHRRRGKLVGVATNGGVKMAGGVDGNSGVKLLVGGASNGDVKMLGRPVNPMKNPTYRSPKK
ncbi:MAG: hypothetical protein H7836_17555 [Magnetococcus sp. YQC-3]